MKHIVIISLLLLFCGCRSDQNKAALSGFREFNVVIALSPDKISRENILKDSLRVQLNAVGTISKSSTPSDNDFQSTPTIYLSLEEKEGAVVGKIQVKALTKIQKNQIPIFCTLWEREYQGPLQTPQEKQGVITFKPSTKAYENPTQVAAYLIQEFATAYKKGNENISPKFRLYLAE